MKQQNHVTPETLRHELAVAFGELTSEEIKNIPESISAILGDVNPSTPNPQRI